MKMTAPQISRDIEFLTEKTEEIHPLGRGNSQEIQNFQNRSQQLIASQKSMEHTEFMLELCKLTALLNDSHTKPLWQLSDDYCLPFKFDIVDHTLFISETTKDWVQLIGCKLIAIDSIPLEELVKRCKRFYYGENSNHERLQVVKLIHQPLFLSKLIQCREESEQPGNWSIPFHLETPEDDNLIEEISFVRLQETSFSKAPSKISQPELNQAQMGFCRLPDRPSILLLSIDACTLYRETIQSIATNPKLGRSYLQRILTSDQFKALETMGKERFLKTVPSAEEITQQVIAELIKNGGEMLIFDLSRNRGGDSQMAKYLLTGIQQLQESLPAIKIAAVLSARTFSAAFDIAVQLANQGVFLVGTCPAQSGCCFIDSLPITLTESEACVIISQRKVNKMLQGSPVGKELRLDFSLTYEHLKRYSFDPNSHIRLAIESLQSSHNREDHDDLSA